MDEPTGRIVTDGVVGAAILAGVRWLLGRHMDEVASHAERIRNIENTYVSRDDLRKYMEYLRQERTAMHEQNQASIREIANRVTDLTNLLLNRT